MGTNENTFTSPAGMQFFAYLSTNRDNEPNLLEPDGPCLDVATYYLPGEISPLQRSIRSGELACKWRADL